ncbi:MAG: FxsC protein [Acidobacteria bacterium]|nr:FxsC protein [Acidobacteriota bacterium]
MSEPHDFFFSYSRRDYENADIYLTTFLKDLSKEIRIRRVSSKGEEVAYFDQHKLTRGDDWKQELLDALQTARTLVCLYSPNYFASEYCGKEWQVMHMRREQYLEEQRLAKKQKAKLPRIIKPIPWILPYPQDFKTMSDPVGDAHYHFGSLTSGINTRGLLHVIRRRSVPEFELEYLDFIEGLASEIVNDAEDYPVGKLTEELKISGVSNAFVRKAPAAAAPAAPVKTEPVELARGPNYVHFVYVAARPEEVQQNGRAQVNAYSHIGGREWQPYYPPEESYIDTLAKNVASTKGLGFITRELAMSANLENDIEAAQNQHNLVILLVDSWTAGISPYKEWLNKFDKRRFFNCSVLVPWNEQDQETAAQCILLQERLQAAFPYNTDLDNTTSIYYCGPVTSEEELRTKLQEILIKLRDKVKKKIPLPNTIQGGGGLDNISGGAK